LCGAGLVDAEAGGPAAGRQLARDEPRIGVREALEGSEAGRPLAYPGCGKISL
jgi:hypothetical protein